MRAYCMYKYATGLRILRNSPEDLKLELKAVS